MDYKNFYAELGKLLYAAADVDKVITPDEKKIIYDLVHRSLVPASTHRDAFGTDTAYYAEFEVDILDDAVADGKTQLQSFTDYIDNHPHLITGKLREVCLALAEQVAAAYKNSNMKSL